MSNTIPILHPHVPSGRFDLAELLSYEPPTRWRPEPGERVQGQLVKIEERRSFNKSAPTIFILVPPITDDPHTAKYVTVRASGVVLRGCLDSLRPRIGEEIAIKNDGMKLTADGLREYAMYRMAVLRAGRWVVAQ